MEGGRKEKEEVRKEGREGGCDTFIIAGLANTKLESEVTLLTLVRYTVYLPNTAHIHHDITQIQN